ncbi:aminotransferase class V-fold PLP-dependent enzyme [soil metagenome]
MKTTDWLAARERVHLDPTVCMLNTGSFGPTPKPVFERVTQLRERQAAGPTDFLVRQVPPLLWHARCRTAEFLGTEPTRLVFTPNVSHAINIIASGLTWQSPGEILISDHEYGAMIWCWERVAQRQGLSIRTFALPKSPSSSQEIVDAAVASMTPQTRVIFFSHVLSPTGMVLPAQMLCAEARKRGIMSVIDGAHAPAMIPLQIDTIQADYYSGNLHKWLLAPIGAGFLGIGRGNEDCLQPLQVSWGYHPDRYPLGEATTPPSPDSPDAYGSTARTRYLEFEGTRDICPWLAVPDAIDFQSALGWDAIRNRHTELANYSRAKVTKLPLATPSALEMRGSMTAFELPAGTNAAELRRKLWERRIEIPIIERPDRTLIRISHHFYTLEREIDTLTEALAEFVS